MKLVNINIEGDKHLDRIIPFIRKESPDVLCLQEVLETDLEAFKKIGYAYEYLPMTLEPGGISIGIALCSKEEIEHVTKQYYRDTRPGLHVHDRDDKANTIKNGIIFTRCSHEHTSYPIATTHFTWTPHGDVPNAEQITDMDTFITFIATHEPHIMCGDFNIPRKFNPLYEKLVEHYTDAVPLSYASSLDATLHRCGGVPDKRQMFESFMVDYVFTKPPYTAHDVHLEFGISDHAAVVATIGKSS